MIDEQKILAGPMGDLFGTEEEYNQVIAQRLRLIDVALDHGAEAFKSELNLEVSRIGAREAYFLGAAMVSAVYASIIGDKAPKDPAEALVHMGEFLGLGREEVYVLMEKFGRFSNSNIAHIQNQDYVAYKTNLDGVSKSFVADELIMFGGIMGRHFL